MDGTAANLAKSAGDNGFEILSLLNQRFDPMRAQTQARMVNRITALIKTPGPASNFKETQERINLLDRFVQEYEERMGAEPDVNIVCSTFTNLLDAETRGTFVQRELLEDYHGMRVLYNNLVAQSLSASVSPMEIGALAEKPSEKPFEWGEEQEKADEQPQSPWNYYGAPHLDAFKGKGKGKGKGDGS